MIPELSANTRAILLLTAPLIVGRKSENSVPLLTPTEYRQLARCLYEHGRQPLDLLETDIETLLGECRRVIDEERMRALLGRGFLLGQALEQWHVRGIWVVSRSDPGYPSYLVSRFRDQAPPVFYGCGDIGLLAQRGLAVVGSRHVDEALMAYTRDVGALAASAGRSIVSGGAKGVDQASMFGALDAGGRVIGVLANGLERASTDRTYRDALMQGRLVLVSPFDPRAGFNVGNAMQRNKFIYGLSDAAFVVNVEYNKGGTWNGAREQLKKFQVVPVYVRTKPQCGQGASALLALGALPWPDPQDCESFRAVFVVHKSSAQKFGSQKELPLPIEAVVDNALLKTTPGNDETLNVFREDSAEDCEVEVQSCASKTCAENREDVATASAMQTSDPAGEIKPSEILFATVREILRECLQQPRNVEFVAQELDVGVTLARKWLERLVKEEIIVKQTRPVAYVVR
ncbi:MAG: DNA-processing protein DprA [Desulfoplanes sp.]|nr:DNA-processing protein DprA [Desulfoplanes sp.]